MIRLSTYAELIAQAELVREYAKECSLPEIGEVQPNGEIYAAMERIGVAQVFAAYSRPLASIGVGCESQDADSVDDNSVDQMIGFAAILMPVMPHYSKRVATVESIFVTESQRKSGIGKDLMRTIEDYAKEKGCAAILYSAPAGGKFERVLDASKHYRRSNSVFVGNLD